MKYIISSSYGNDSIALIQYAINERLKGCHVVYIDTGWSKKNWKERIKQGEKLCKANGIKTHRIKGELTFETLVLAKKGFPSNQYQFCSGALKGVPFSEFCHKHDKKRKAIVMLGKRREESKTRSKTPLRERSKYHEDRMVWNPLISHTESQRNSLCRQANIKILNHRSMECCPCVNANKKDFHHVGEKRIRRIEFLEKAINNTMFRPYLKMGASGIREVITWSKTEHGKFIKSEKCESGLCG